ncbi:hypothetical protein OROHE_016143 [Orobanche hederae]
MGNKMKPETLEEGFLDPKPSRIETPCNKIPEGIGFVSLCNLNNNSTDGAVNNGRLSVNDVKLAAKLGHGSIKESVLVDGIVGNNELNKGCSSDSYPDNKLSVLADDNGINGNEVPNFGGDFKLSGDDGIRIGKSDGVSFSHEPKSQTNGEVFGDGINLFVEVCVPLDGISVSHSNLNGADEVCSFEKTGILTPAVKSSIPKNEGGENVGKQECMFEVGDLVWVKTRTPLWWPGTITDPSNASNDEKKSKKKHTLLVKCFGNGNFIWCNNSGLRPFIEYFEHLSRQNTSKSFYDAVERALCEIDRHVRSKMMCPCFSKENKSSEEDLMLVGKNGKIGDVLSLARFEPVNFLTCIKQFAGSVYTPNKIELTVVKNRLSSFYRSVGHRELSLQMLSELKYDGRNDSIFGCREKSTRAKKKRNPSDYDDLASGDKIASSGKGSESRKRKKGKLDDILKQTISRKDGSAKSSKGHHIISKSDNISASSFELLTELCLTACDYFYLDRSKYSDSLRRFYSSFRLYAFVDADVADSKDGTPSAPKHEKPRHKKSLNETKRQNKRINKVKESECASANLEFVEKSVDNYAMGKKFSKMDNARGKKEERVMSAGPESGKSYHDSSFYKVCFDVPISNTASNKRDEANPGLTHGGPISRLPDLNKYSPISVEHVPFGGLSESPFRVLPEQENEGLVSPQNIPQFKISTTNDANQCQNGESNTQEAGHTVIYTGLASFVPQSMQVDLFPKNEPKKRKRYEKKASQVASSIPDLNGNASDMNPLEKTTLFDGNILSSEGKPQQKRANKEEDPGGSVILKFSRESDLPSKEILVAAFCRYGLLKESEIKVLSDSTVQMAYERTSDARFAFRSLEKSHSFGESLVSFDLNCMPEKKIEKKMRKQPFVHVKACKNRARPVEKPDITFMKQNVEMMKSTLEKMGDKIPPEMRARLENEIKLFLDKIASMSGSSSSF